MTDRPLWQQVHDSLRSQITTGLLVPGTRLPSEPELMAAHGVRSRETIRRAARELVSEGLIDGQRRVTERKPITLRLSDEETITFIEDMARGGHVVAPPEITVKIEGGWLVREVLRVVDGEPHNWARWRFPIGVAQGTRLAYDTDIPEGSVRYVKEALGWTGLKQEKWIEVRPATREEMAVLSPPPGWNVIAEHRTGGEWDLRETPVFDAVRILRADRTRLIP